MFEWRKKAKRATSLEERIARYERRRVSQTAGDQEMAEDPTLKGPDFTTTLLVALEMLKRGAAVVDIHPWGLRLRDPGGVRDAWSVGLIPQRAVAEYHDSLLRPPAPPESQEPEPQSPTNIDEGDQAHEHRNARRGTA